ncbi:hypothetical protein F4779DRAFT_637994 [Xylariaceae sp. FL0662B]|nr:hypothetical protein F4779DRAFT_637994 [Xylariaceae sp. FL0662B]
MDSTTAMKTITPTSGINLLVHLGIERLRETTTSPARNRAPGHQRSRVCSGDYSCFLPNSFASFAAAVEEAERPSKLLALPNEVQYMIVSHLGFGDLERLRRTCRHYRLLLNPRYVRARFGGDSGLASQLAEHCRACLARPGRHVLLLNADARATCFACAAQARARDHHNHPLRVGTRVSLANAREAWVCRWCGWPVAGGPASWASEQFHVRCYDAYYRVLWVFLCLGFVQFAVGVVAAAMAWVFYRTDVLVFPPAVASFVLLWACVAGLAFRGNRVRTYHWVGLVELAILGLWIPPVYKVVRDLPEGAAVQGWAVATLVFFAVNMIFRLLNLIGNIVLYYEYDITKHYVPEQSRKRRLLNMVMAGLIYWTYPQCVEQRYSPDWN